MKDNSKKSDRLETRISPKQEIMIKRKAESYKSLSTMILDAVQQFDDTGTMRKIKKLNEMVDFYKKYQHELSWLSGNLNQVVYRACELSTSEEVMPTFITDMLFPRIDEIQEIIKDIKGEQYQSCKETHTIENIIWILGFFFQWAAINIAH